MVSNFTIISTPNIQETGLSSTAPTGDISETVKVEKQYIPKGFLWEKLLVGGLIYFASVTSNISLPPLILDRRRETSSILFLYSAPKRRQISLTEARQIALAVLWEAEMLRDAYAKKEAQLITIWEEER